jgi:drug/metabolite transporter (DMT)-like permease
MSKHVKAFALLLSLGFIWGSGYSIAKYAITHGVAPLGYSFWQSLGPALLLSILVIVQNDAKKLVSKRFFPFFVICGLVGIAIPNTNMYIVSPHLPAGLLSVIVNTVPIMTYPIALLMAKERFDWIRFIAIIIGFSGILLIVHPSHSLPIESFSPYSWLALLSPLSFAICSVYIAVNRPQGASPVLSSCGMLLTSAVLLTPIVIAAHSFYPLTPPYDLAKCLVILEVILSTLGYVMFFALIRLSGPVFYSLTGGIVALTGLFWGYIIFDEHLTLLHGIALSLILGSILLLSWHQEKAHAQ